MQDRHRTALTAIVLTLGFFSPFAVGLVAHRHLPEIRGILAVHEPRRAKGAKSLRFRFDLIRIGMTGQEVEALMGPPSQDNGLVPTHAEIWSIEKGAVSHKTWGPPWKVYFLTPCGNDVEAPQWAADGVQAFVVYDGSRNVKEKIWFDRRVVPPDVIPLFFGAAVAAICVWMTVWIVNHRTRFTKRALVTTAVAALPVLYLASFGPACWISSRLDSGSEIVSSFYQPILAVESPRIVRRAIVSYAFAFSAGNWVISGPSSTTDSKGVTTVDPGYRWQPRE